MSPVSAVGPALSGAGSTFPHAASLTEQADANTSNASDRNRFMDFILPLPAVVAGGLQPAGRVAA